MSIAQFFALWAILDLLFLFVVFARAAVKS